MVLQDLMNKVKSAKLAKSLNYGTHEVTVNWGASTDSKNRPFVFLEISKEGYLSERDLYYFETADDNDPSWRRLMIQLGYIKAQLGVDEGDIEDILPATVKVTKTPYGQYANYSFNAQVDKASETLDDLFQEPLV